MPKMKTHKGLTKRFKVTASGKLKHKRACGSHLMRSKNAKRRRRIATPAVLTGVFAEKMKLVLER